MFRQKTTLIIGSGASKEVNLPLGDELKAKIGDLLETSDGPRLFSNASLSQFVEQDVSLQRSDAENRRQSWHLAAERILRGLPAARSIDNYLHTHQSDSYVQRLGKAAIAIVMIEEEGKSYLFESEQQGSDQEAVMPRCPSISNPKLAESWYPSLATLLMAGTQKEDPNAAFALTRFVIFNYDRCLEQYLYLAVQAYYDISAEEASQVMQSVEFIHPYGSLGALPWQVLDGGEGVPLGAQHKVDYLKIAEGLRTFTQSADSDVGNHVLRAVAEAQTIIILGFGFIPQNVDLLTPLVETNAQRMISTAFDVPAQGIEVLQRTMKKIVSNNNISALIEHRGCRELFKSFELHLSLE